MKTASCLLLAQFFAAPHLHAASADDAAVREMVNRYSNARDASDPKAIGTLFTTDADQLVSTGEWRRGADALVKGMIASSARESGKRTLAVETVRFLGPDVAIADARYEIGDRKMWSTFVMRRVSGAWRIEAIRNMLPTTQANGPQKP